MSVPRHHKALHRLFVASVWIKGVAGIAETLAGLLIPFVTEKTVAALVVRLTAPELGEDPEEWHANYLAGALQHFAAHSKVFASIYLVVHGLIKIILVAGLLWGRRLWAYPASLWFLAAFIAYQMYRFTSTHSMWLVLLTVLDLVVAYLIWREYQWRKLHHGKA